MTDAIIPVDPKTTTRKEVRAVQIVGLNDLDADPSRPDLKYGFLIHRVVEPQNDSGEQTGARIPLPPFQVPMLDVLTRTFTRPDGSTFSGAQHLMDHNMVVDHYKAMAEIPSPEPAADPVTP